MRKIFWTVIMIVFIPKVFAEVVAPTANIKISPDWAKAQCAAQPGKGVTLVWGGVTDKRASASVATLKSKKEEVEVRLGKSPDAVVGDAVKTVLKNCGFTIETTKNASGVEISAELQELFAGAKKGFFTGETDAKGALVLHFNNGGATYDFNLGATRSDKRLKKKNIQQLEQVLKGLVETVVTQIGESPALFDEVKK